MQLDKMILGALMLHNQEFIYSLKSEYFENQDLFNTIRKVYDESKATDINDICREYKKVTKQDIYSYCSECMDDGILGITEYHINKLIDKHEKKKVRELLINSINDYENLNVIELASNIINSLEERTTEDDSIQAVADRFMEQLNTPLNRTEMEKYYYDSDIGFLNSYTAGIQKGELTTVAAKSGVGKTLFVMQNIKRWSEHNKVLMVSREMKGESLFKRILVKETGIDNMKFKLRRFEKDEWTLIRHIVKIIKETSNMHLDSKTSTITGIKRRLIQEKSQILVIDYLQLLEAEGNHHSREREVAWLSKELKNIAIDFNIPVVVLSQLNDESKDGRPSGERDMRESKAIYHDSDNVIFIHKPNFKEISKYVEMGTLDETDIDNVVEIIINKQRDGMVGRKLCRSIKAELRFKEIHTDN